MSIKTIIGHVNCPICGHVDAEVRPDKNDRAYIHCKFACGWQGITRNNHQSDQLKARMRPVTVPTVTVPEPAAPKAPAPAAPPPRPPGAAKAAPPEKKPEEIEKEKKPRTPWFQPILGAANG